MIGWMVLGFVVMSILIILLYDEDLLTMFNDNNETLTPEFGWLLLVILAITAVVAYLSF